MIFVENFRFFFSKFLKFHIIKVFSQNCQIQRFFGNPVKNDTTSIILRFCFHNNLSLQKVEHQTKKKLIKICELRMLVGQHPKSQLGVVDCLCLNCQHDPFSNTFPTDGVTF